MTDRPTDEELRALIAGDDADALGPDEVAELPLLADVLADASTWAEPSADLEDAIVAAVTDAQPNPNISLTPTPSAARAHTTSRLPRVLLAAAAVLVVVAIGGAVAVRSQQETDYRGQLAATALAPGASGAVDVTRNGAGFRLTLDASGLPTLSNGEYYQAWLKGANDTLVPIGTFSGDDGVVTLWSGVSPTDFPTLSVTIEAPDNNQASSGRRVLVGDVKPA